MSEQKYKRYVIAVLGGFVLLYLFSAVWVWTGYFCPQNDTLWVNHLYQHKESYAKSIKVPKIVIVSGSSGLYGLSAEQMERHFNIPTVNLSTHAGLRDYYFYRARKSLACGDLMILSPEYQQYFFNSPMSDVKADYILNFDRPYLKNLPFTDQLEVLKTYVNPWKIIRDSAVFYVKGKKGAFHLLLNTRTLNRNGDITGGFGTREYEITPVSLLPGRFKPDTHGMEQILAFIRWCQANHIRVLVSWPGTLPMINTLRNEPYTRFTEALMAFLARSGVETMGTPEDFFMSKSDMFDTIYHLNLKGISRRTSKLIGFLEKSRCFQEWRNSPVGKGGSPEETLQQTEVDVCHNGTMEASENKEVSGWRPVTGEKGHSDGAALWDGAEAHGGQYSLKLMNTTGGQVRWAGEKVALPAGIRKIVAGGWSKSENIADTATYCINLKVFFKDGSFQWYFRDLFFRKGTHDWNQVQASIDFDKDVVAVQPFLILYSSVAGCAWFDDVFIRVSTGNGSFGGVL
jgi:hypothetical protein